MRYRSVGGFALGTLFSRILGLVREGVIAYLLGATRFSDALYVALRIPNILRDILAEGSIQTAFIPTYVRSREEKKNPEGFLSAIFLSLLSVGTLIVLLGIIAAPYLVMLFAFGFTREPEKFSLTVSLTRITFPFLLVVALAALLGGVLNAFRKFFVPALSPFFFNLGVIALGVLAVFLGKGPVGSSHLLAWGILVGGILQALFQVPFLGKIKRSHSLIASPDFRHPYLKSFLRLLLPVLLSTTLTRFSLFVNTLIASFMRHGAISYLNYAYRVMHLPLGLFGVGVATVILPDLSGIVSRGEKIGPELRKAVHLTLFLTLPVALFLAVDSLSIVSLLFQRGSFDASAANFTARALVFYTLGIPFFSISRVLLNYYYAQHRIRVPNMVFLAGTSANLIIALSLSPVLDFPALALATSTAGVTQALILYLLTKRETGESLIGFSFLKREVILLLMLSLTFLLTRSYFSGKITLLIADAAAGTGIYLLFSYLLGMKEPREILRR